MPTDAASHGVAALRRPAWTARLARALWIAWAVIVWNVVFDHAIVTAGRLYVVAAARAAASHAADAPVVRMDEWMRPAATRGLWTASAVSGGLLLVGLAVGRRARGAGADIAG